MERVKLGNKGFMDIFSRVEIEEGRFPQDMIAHFEGVGRLQRSADGCPERIMREAQREIGGGVLTSLMEHIGDLTHRLTHHIKYGDVYPCLVKDKVDRGIRNIDRGASFDSECRQNVQNNAEYFNVSVEHLQGRLDDYLEKYAQAHAKITVYNRPQWLAREAAVLLGRKDFDGCLRVLNTLNKLLENTQEFERLATIVYRDQDGVISEYSPEPLKRECEPEVGLEMCG